MVLKIKNKKIIYVPLAVDILHSGHLNILNKAKKYGSVVVGLLSDKAIVEYKKLPTLGFNERLKIVKNLKNVSKIIVQDTWDYTVVLNQLKPNYFMHGDDWKNGIQKSIRKKVISELKKNNGKLIEVPYTKNISSTSIKDELVNRLTPSSRISNLKRLILSKKIVRILESHSPLTGLIIENLRLPKKNYVEEFDGMWSSSLTDSSLKGKPDNQSLDFSARFNGLGDVLDVTTKPMIFDADNGGRLEHIPYTVRSLERLGISAIMIEDKIGLKKNSLFKNQKNAKQDSIKNFCKKIDLIKKVRNSKNFLIGARIESFILGVGLKDALRRAEAHSKAGADIILIHSKEKTPKEIFSFGKIFKKSKYYKPLVAVPSTYSKTKESELVKYGFKIVIYANQLLRASYPAMVNVAKSILNNKRSSQIEKKISSVNEVINLIK